jgi:hypothetical protein
MRPGSRRNAWIGFVAACLASRVRAQDHRLAARDGGGDRFGASMAPAGDWNGDGIGDLIVGAPRPCTGSEPGYAAVLSGANGQVLRVLAGQEGDDHFGIAVAGGEDLDGDGRADAVVGGVSWKGQTHGIAGVVRVFSGADGHLLRKLTPPEGAEMFGRELLLLDDVDGDGKGDVLVGCPALNATLDGGVGRVIAYSGAAGTRLYESVGRDRKDKFAQSLARAGDLDGDSVGDVLIGAPDGFDDIAPNHVRAISGRDGETLFTLEVGPRRSGFGYSLAGEHDWNGDGVPDFAVGTSRADRTAWGLRIFSGADRSLLASFEPDGEIHRPGEAAILIGGPQQPSGTRLVAADRFSDPPSIRIRTAGGAWSTVTDVPGPARSGLRLCALGDVDGDGSDDFAASSDRATAPGDLHGPSIGEVAVYSGATGARLYSVRGGIGP